MPERFKVVCIPCKVLYKCSALPLPFSLGKRGSDFCTTNTVCHLNCSNYPQNVQQMGSWQSINISFSGSINKRLYYHESLQINTQSADMHNRTMPNFTQHIVYIILLRLWNYQQNPECKPRNSMTFSSTNLIPCHANTVTASYRSLSINRPTYQQVWTDYKIRLWLLCSSSSSSSSSNEYY